MYHDHIRARGHRNIKATHRSTFEITKETYLTPRGDCIVAVASNKGLRDLDPLVKKHITMGWPVMIIISPIQYPVWDYSIGVGHSGLTLNDPVRIIARKSSYISGNTIMIRSSKSAGDFRRDLIRAIRNEKVEIDIYVLVAESRSHILKYAEDLGFRLADIADHNHASASC